MYRNSRNYQDNNYSTRYSPRYNDNYSPRSSPRSGPSPRYYEDRSRSDFENRTPIIYPKKQPDCQRLSKKKNRRKYPYINEIKSLLDNIPGQFTSDEQRRYLTEVVQNIKRLNKIIAEADKEENQEDENFVKLPSASNILEIKRRNNKASNEFLNDYELGEIVDDSNPLKRKCL